MASNNNPLTPEAIRELITTSRIKRQSFTREMAAKLGITEYELTRQYEIRKNRHLVPRKPPRRTRLENIMHKRYQVPVSLIEALIDEYEGSY